MAGTYPFWIEPRWLDVARHRVPVAGLGGPVRLAHVSALHASLFVSQAMIADAVKLTVAARPDVICITGDFISDRDVPDAHEYARTLRPLAAAAPTYAVMGNHDGGLWSAERRGFADHGYVDRVLEMAGIELLHNRSKAIEVRGGRLTLAGLGDFWAGEMDPRRAFREAVASPVVALSHNPDTKDLLDRYPWQLLLSGHTHGGQVIVPLYGPPIVPVQDRRYVAGLKGWQERQIHVTRGVGNLMGVRFACRPEVAVLDLFAPRARMEAASESQTLA
jgi:predicted MPP superfamily phosphohydrolase